MYQNWILFIVVLVIVVLMIAVSSKTPIQRFIAFKTVMPFFGLWFIVLIILTTINADWDLCEDWDSCGSDSSNSDDCNDKCCGNANCCGDCGNKWCARKRQ